MQTEWKERLNPRRIRLIACDLDGTLLLNGAQQLRPETCGLIHALGEKGIRFFAASGRQYANLRRLFAPIRDEIGYVCENGALCVCGGRRLHAETMDSALGRAVIAEALQCENIEIAVTGAEKAYLCPRSDWFEDYMRRELRFDVEVVPDLLGLRQPFMKVSLYERAGITDEAFWQGRFSGPCKIVNSGNDWLDVMPPHVNKAFGLRYALECLDIPPEACMAVGDNDNDIEMLRYVGMPVTVASAKPTVRAMAALETDRVERLLSWMLAELEAGAD